MLSRRLMENAEKFIQRDVNIEHFLKTLALAATRCIETRDEILKVSCPACLGFVHDGQIDRVALLRCACA